MTSAHQGRPLRAAIALLAMVLVGLAFAATATIANASPAKKTTERVVVRGDDTIQDTGACPGGVCPMQIVGGAFRGTLGNGAYDGALNVHVAESFPNGEGGVCAPVDGTMTLGAGTPDRLVLAFSGVSCQDGNAPLPASSFTGVAHWVVKYGTGAYANASGHGVYLSSEDANDHERLTLIGRITR
jgi:hypothetical protein